MTLIVNPKHFGSKAALKLNLEAGTAVIENPAVIGGWTKLAKDLPAGFRDVVTNHPKRNKYATIQKVSDSEWKVT